MSTTTVAISASDVTGQRNTDLPVPSDHTVAETTRRLLERMGLVKHDRNGHPLTYRARLDREGRNLNGSERIGDILESGDHLVLQPSITAGL